MLLPPACGSPTFQQTNQLLVVTMRPTTGLSANDWRWTSPGVSSHRMSASHVIPVQSVCGLFSRMTHAAAEPVACAVAVLVRPVATTAAASSAPLRLRFMVPPGVPVGCARCRGVFREALTSL
ncbi:hypothetical protein SALBM135S_01935 [Streptomyces alboniger]